MTTETAKFDKLPKWAQDKIKLQEASLKHLNNHVASLFTQKPTKVEYEPYRCSEDARLFLPDRSHIAFEVDGGNILVRIENGMLYVMGNGSLSSALIVKPNSSNTLNIGFEHDGRF